MKQYECALNDVLDEYYALEEKWIQKMDLKKGALRKALKVKKGHDIPMNKLNKAANSQNPTMRRRAALALKFKSMAAARNRGR